MRTFVVANPYAGRGRVGKRFAELLSTLGAEGVLTGAKGDAIDLATKARGDGYELVVAVGGDGTVSEVANGLLDAGVDGAPALGVIAAGSGCDFARTFGLPLDLDQGAARVRELAVIRTIDAGRIICEGRTRWFVNIADAGIIPAIAARAERLPRALKSLRYPVAFFLTIPRYKRARATVVTGDQTYDGPLTALVVANAKAFGGGMWIAPGADPGDGLLDAQIHWGSKLDYIRGIRKVYKGTHLPHPKVIERRIVSLDVNADPPVLVDADGEVIGSTPARFEIVPGALRLVT